MIDPRSISELRAAHPMPWRYETRTRAPVGAMGAQIVALDGNNREVPLSVLLKVVHTVTHRIAETPP